MMPPMTSAAASARRGLLFLPKTPPIPYPPPRGWDRAAVVMNCAAASARAAAEEAEGIEEELEELDLAKGLLAFVG